MKKATCALFVVLFFGCTRNPLVNEHLVLRLNNKIYDSIQVFVDANISANTHSSIYLLDFIQKRGDSIDYALTTLLKQSVNDKYKDAIYCYNKDSSLLIINSDCISLFDNSGIYNTVKNLKWLKLSNDSGNVIFDPLMWKLTIIGDRVIIDRTYGQRIAKEKVVFPKEKFDPETKIKRFDED